MTEPPGVPRQDVADLGAAISALESALPGWWWTTGACGLSRDASCGPDRGHPDMALCYERGMPDAFHADLLEGTCADALRAVTAEALAAKEAANGKQS